MYFPFILFLSLNFEKGGRYLTLCFGDIIMINKKFVTGEDSTLPHPPGPLGRRVSGSGGEQHFLLRGEQTAFGTGGLSLLLA